ncbi:MAG: hypothetical protein K8I27_02010 [Planctomycetes bacterium]|nr:hypothetical protein [Planctomycetota bacterium]
MIRTFALLLAIAALIAVTAKVSDARVLDRALAKDDRSEAYDEFERLLPLAAASDDEKNADEVRDCLTKGKSPYLTIAAVEAVRQAEANKRSSGKVFLPEVLALMGQDFDKLHKEEIVPVNVIACLGVLAKGDEEASLKVVRALIDWQKWSENQIVRLRHMAERVLLDLTEEDSAFNPDTLAFWEWWLRNKENKQKVDDADKPPEKRSKTAPIIFKEPMVGTRVVFVIDVSDSMKWPIKDEDIDKIKKKADHLNWDEMPDPPTPMALAKAELRHSIDKLRPDKSDGKDKKKGTRSAKGDPEMRHFAIVTYSTEVVLWSEGWVEATDKNCNVWMDNVDDLEPDSTTNIHGAIKQAFELSEKRNKTENPELDKDCVLTGAHTIVFLTDGYPTWSDDSSDSSAKDEWGNPVGNGEYVKRDKLLELQQYINRFRKVVVNTVGIGIHDKKLMKGFAEDSGGGYTDWGCGIDYGQKKD